MKIRVAKMKRHCSGQIMAEACIGLALLSFTWILISYTSFMTTNRIRTAMAARHAAWRVAKEGVDPQSISSEINADFFYNSFATVETGDAAVDEVDKAGRIGVSLVRILTVPLILLHGSISDSSAPNRTRVTFGIKPADLNSPNVSFPFSLMNTHVPFMTNSLLAGFLSVNSQCQWAAIKDTWSDKPSTDPWSSNPILGALHVVGTLMNKTFGVILDAYNDFLHGLWWAADKLWYATRYYEPRILGHGCGCWKPPEPQYHPYQTDCF